MRAILLISAALISGSCATEAGARPSEKSSRTAEVIVMSTAAAPTKRQGGIPLTTGTDPDGGELVQTLASAPLPPAFKTHDLSRRWVAFEMASSFAASALPVATETRDSDTFAHVGVATIPTDSGLSAAPIAIPQWMNGGAAFATAPRRISARCPAYGYQPAGFLDAGTELRRSGYYGMMSSIACEYGIPVGLFDAMIIRESRYDAGVFSPKRAFGLTQLMPDTAAGLGVNRYDVEQNLRGGALYLRQQLDRFGQVHLALAAYNAGPGRIRNGALPRIAETQAYVENVLLNWRRLLGFTPPNLSQDVRALSGMQRPTIARAATVTLY